MPIVLISESLLLRSTVTDGRILRDRVLCGFCVRLGSPRFMLHDRRKLVATVGEKLRLSSAVLRRILNHTAPRTDVLQRHYVGLGVEDVADGLTYIQVELDRLCRGSPPAVAGAIFDRIAPPTHLSLKNAPGAILARPGHLLISRRADTISPGGKFMKKRSNREARASHSRDEAAIKLIALGAGVALIPTLLGHSPMIAALAPLRPVGLLMLAAGALFFWLNRRAKDSNRPEDSDQTRGRKTGIFGNVQPFPNKRTISDVEQSSDQPPIKPTTWSAEVFDVIEWRRFEALVEALFQKAGFLTKSQSHGADDGVDIWISQHSKPDTPVSLIQCKHWLGRKVGVDKVREFFGVMTSFKVERGQFITTSSFTPDAEAFGKDNRIDLIDRHRLLMMIAKRPDDQQRELLDVALEGEYWKPTCVNCGVKMLTRTPRGGGKDFWGCINYPQCKTTMQMRQS